MTTTFNANQMSKFTLELSDREIYNDIRAECDITEILELRPDATPEFFETFTVQGDYWGVPPNSSMDITVYAADEHSEVVWLQVVDFYYNPVTQFDLSQEECEDLGGTWRDPGMGAAPFCILPPTAPATYRIISRDTYSCTVRVTNESNWWAITVVFLVSYLALTPETRYIKLRSTDDASISKYGRRTMNLTWPLGQHPNTMQSIIDNYRDRHSEPVPLCMMTLEADIKNEDDENISYILETQLEDKLEIIHAGLAMDEEFFVNELDVLQNREGTGLLTGTFTLEQVRDMEQLTYFTIGTSLIGGDHVIAP